METPPEFNSLPIILVSAKDQDSATDLISEIIDNEPDYSSTNRSKKKLDRVWRLANKYYTADVRLHPLADGAELEPESQDHVEGHIVYLTADEASGGMAAEAMRRRCGAGARAAVRLLVTDSASEEAAAAAAAAARRYALVPWRAGASADCREPAGPGRARAALHAHLWPNMRAARPPPPPPPNTGGGDDGDSDTSWSSWQGADAGSDCSAQGTGDSGEEERGSEELEGVSMSGFSSALGALRRGAALRPPLLAPRPLRLRHAEHVLAAFCAALGDLPEPPEPPEPPAPEP